MVGIPLPLSLDVATSLHCPITCGSSRNQTPPDLVVDQGSADVERHSTLALRCVRERWTMLGHCTSREICLAISTT